MQDADYFLLVSNFILIVQKLYFATILSGRLQLMDNGWKISGDDTCEFEGSFIVHKMAKDCPLNVQKLSSSCPVGKEGMFW